MTIADGPPPPPHQRRVDMAAGTTVSGWVRRSAWFQGSRTVPWAVFMLVGLVRSDGGWSTLGWGAALAVAVALSVLGVWAGHYSLNCSMFRASDLSWPVRISTDKITRFDVGSGWRPGVDYLIVRRTDGQPVGVRDVAASWRTGRTYDLADTLNHALAECRGVPYETIIKGQLPRPVRTGITGSGKPAVRALRLLLAIGASIVTAAVAVVAYWSGQTLWIPAAIVILGVTTSVRILRRIHLTSQAPTRGVR